MTMAEGIFPGFKARRRKHIEHMVTRSNTEAGEKTLSPEGECHVWTISVARFVAVHPVRQLHRLLKLSQI